MTDRFRVLVTHGDRVPTVGTTPRNAVAYVYNFPSDRIVAEFATESLRASSGATGGRVIRQRRTVAEVERLARERCDELNGAA